MSDDLVTTRHRVKAGRRTLRYTATSGRVVLRHEKLDDGEFKGHQPQAEVFVTAYTLDTGTGSDDADAKPDPQRPVTFCFNGGPGSSSVWLHLGLLGPRRVLMGDAGELLPPPYGLADNAETLLAHSDLVFIDPVSTGYSRAVEGGKPKEFHGYTADIESVGEVIRLWTTRNGRWMSPKFLAGESYGTLRAAALAEHLQSRYGMYLNGIMLISMVLDMGTIRFTEGNDLPHALYLPTYAAIAHHHGLHGDRTLADVLAEAEEYAARDYPWVLSRGARLTPSQRSAAVRKIAGLTGLPRDYVDRADLRIEHLRFFTELLRGQGRTVGRLDGRFAGLGQGPRLRAPRPRPVVHGHPRALQRRLQPLRPRGPRVRERPALRDPHRQGAAVVVQGVRGPLGLGGLEALGGDAHQPAPAGPRRLRLPRRRHALHGRRAHPRPPAHPGRPAGEHRGPLLRGGPHDVRPRAVPGAAVQGPGGLHRELSATRTPSPSITVPLTASTRRRTRGRRNHPPARPTAAASPR